MIPTRQADVKKYNPEFREEKRLNKKETNREWVSRVLANTNLEGWVLLLGGTSLTDFRIRVAQSQVRHDLTPSHWSHAAIFGSKSGAKDWNLYEVWLNPRGGFGDIPRENGVQRGKLSQYNNPESFPNIACINFSIDYKTLDKAVNKFRGQRGLIDIGSLIVQWLAFAWGVGEQGNPLLKGIGIPSAAFVEGVFAGVGIELTPGLSTRSSCPEAIWQSARWWYEFYKSEAISKGTPTGCYVTESKFDITFGEDKEK
ncbi:MAG: hypothetical protein L0Y56_22530 [Nitrospira sp.]|nr:hypothetical protein [Nitrospira sp.]